MKINLHVGAAAFIHEESVQQKLTLDLTIKSQLFGFIFKVCLGHRSGMRFNDEI